MRLSLGFRYCTALTALTLAIAFLSLPAVARADLLVNDLSDRVAPLGVCPMDPEHITPTVAFCPHGPAPLDSANALESGGLLALLGICIHPPVNDPGQGGGTVISGAGGGGGTKTGTGSGGGGGTVTAASVSPEPGSLAIGLIGASLAGLCGLVRRRRLLSMLA
jgi:uncharacterized membrane protein YgcG